jgi:hypothetical protein
MDNLIHALKGVPEFRLRLIELAWQVVKEDGSLDVEKLAFYARELDEAIHEAESYSEITKEVVKCLRGLARSQS